MNAARESCNLSRFNGACEKPVKEGGGGGSEMANFLFSSVADPGCLSQIPGPNVSFWIPDPGSKRFLIPDQDPHLRI